MSNIYMTEPPTSGKLLLCTSKGEIEVELWAKETPKACRNIVALALEGYFDNMIWHRVVPQFCIQTGDPTGTGTGGESFYGEPFADEPHQRLKFNRRGLVAMANTGEVNHNESQFFITLDATPELQNKHTIFGKVSGTTIFNVLALSEVELSEEEPDRPVFPPKLLTVKVLENPFPDIVPRITREEKLMQDAARKKARLQSGQRKEKVKKNTGLLSFGEAEEQLGEPDARFKGAKSSHDLLKNDKRLRHVTASSMSLSGAKSLSQCRQEGKNLQQEDSTGRSRTQQQKDGSQKRQARSETPIPVNLSAIRRDHKASQTEKNAAKEIAELEASIRGLSKRKPEDAAAQNENAKKVRKGKALLEEARRKYTASRSSSISKTGPEGREEETMALLHKFQNAISNKNKGAPSQQTKINEAEREKEVDPNMREYGASDDEFEDSSSWRNHRFDYGGKSANEEKYSADSYVTLDPRDTSSTAAAQLGFGSSDAQQRVKEERLRAGGRQGKDYVDECRQRGSEGRRGQKSTDKRSFRTGDLKQPQR